MATLLGQSAHASSSEDHAVIVDLTTRGTLSGGTDFRPAIGMAADVRFAFALSEAIYVTGGFDTGIDVASPDGKRLGLGGVLGPRLDLKVLVFDALAMVQLRHLWSITADTTSRDDKTDGAKGETVAIGGRLTAMFGLSRSPSTRVMGGFTAGFAVEPGVSRVPYTVTPSRPASASVAPSTSLATTRTDTAKIGGGFEGTVGIVISVDSYF